MRLLKDSDDDVIKLLSGKRISNILSFRGHRTLILRSKFILKNLNFLYSFKQKVIKSFVTLL